MMLSMLYSPSIDGGHGLAAWGTRLRFPKFEFNDFSQLTPEMVRYCTQDAKLCRKIYIELVKRMRKLEFTDKGIELEHRAWQLIQKQKENGFAFNIQEAHLLYAKLRNIENDLAGRVHEVWPPTLEHTRTYRNAYRKDGSPSKQYEKHREQFERLEELEDGSYRAFEYISFNIGSPPQRVEKLLELGWKPRADELTPTGNPKPTSKGRLVPSLVEFVEKNDSGGPKLIAQWMEVNARANMINTWIEAYNDDTGCIHGSLWLANTLRYKHSAPNTANIPAVRVGKDDQPLYGQAGAFTYEARNLWTTRDPSTRKLVGVDAKGIQLRVLAHYLNNPEFSDAVLNGDPHSYNQRVGGFETRAVAKTFIYAYLLGAGDAKVGQIIGGSQRDGKEMKTRFIENFPGLKQLMEKLLAEVESTGRIRLCDDTPIIVTAPHTRLGYLLQGDESRIMKQSLILREREVIRRRLDVLKVGDIHDEWQNDALAAHAEEFAYDVCPLAFRRAGELFNYRVPIDCDAKIGLTWASTH